MRNLTIAAMLFCVVSTGFAQNTIEVEFDPHVAACDSVSLSLSRPIDDGFGVFVFAQASENWSQIYGGVSYAPAEWCQVGIGAGMETEGPAGRIGGWLWAGYGKLSGTWLFEQSQSRGSGAWHKTLVQYQASEKLAIGIVDRSFYGYGGVAELTLSDTTKLRGALYEGGGATLSVVKSF